MHGGLDVHDSSATRRGFVCTRTNVSLPVDWIYSLVTHELPTIGSFCFGVPRKSEA